MAASSVTTAAITSTTTYAATPEVDFGYVPRNGLEMFTPTATVVIAFSFDGKNDHGRLDSANFKSTSRPGSRYQKVWFRMVTGSNGIVTASCW